MLFAFLDDLGIALFISVIAIIYLIVSNGGYMNGDASMINEGFTKEMSVDRETSVRYSRVMANKADDSDLPAFINPAFDQDDVSDDMTDEALSSGKGGPRTVRKFYFFVFSLQNPKKLRTFELSRLSNVRALQTFERSSPPDFRTQGSFIHINSGQIFERDLVSSDSVAKSATQKRWVF